MSKKSLFRVLFTPENLPSPLLCSISAILFALLALWSAVDNQMWPTLAQAFLSALWIVLAVISWKRKRKNTTEKVNS